MTGRPFGISWPILLIGAVLTAIAALSVHVVMLQVLNVPFPDDSAAGKFPRYISLVGSFGATMAVYLLARPDLRRFSLPVRCLITFALLITLRELMVRAIVMDGVVTTAWTFSLVTHLPRLAGLLIACAVIVPVADRLDRLWQWALAATVITAAYMFGVQPLVDMAFAPLLNALSYLAHDEIYQVPYGWQVTVPAYITFAEPVAAALAIAWLTWDRLSARPGVRVLQFVTLIMFMKGSVAPTLLYSFYIKGSLPAAIVSESQFALETLTLALMTAATWVLSRRIPLAQENP
jgi:hypothetical protein